MPTLFFIFVFNLLIRLWKFGTIPPLIHSEDFQLRLVSSILNLFIPPLLFFLILKFYKNKKLSLLTAFIYSLLPQSIVEGRIISALFINHLAFFSVEGKQNFLNNFMSFISPSMLFFENVTFYWGGVREFGILYLSTIPFFFSGIYFLIRYKKIIPLIAFLLISLLISSSKEFPESRLVFFLLPLVAFIVSYGIFRLSQFNNLFVKILLSLIFIFSIYEFTEFIHFYFVHYPQTILSSAAKINYPF